MCQRSACTASASTCTVGVHGHAQLERAARAERPELAKKCTSDNAYGSPLNVDQEVDCAVKVLAWEHAKKLLPRVSQY